MTYLRIEFHECTVEISDLPYTSSDKHLIAKKVNDGIQWEEGKKCTKMNGYVIHSLNIPTHSTLSNVLSALVLNTVNPPKRAQRPISTRTNRLPHLPALAPMRMTKNTITMVA